MNKYELLEYYERVVKTRGLNVALKELDRHMNNIKRNKKEGIKVVDHAHYYKEIHTLLSKRKSER